MKVYKGGYCQKRTWTFEKAVQIARGMEAAQKSSQEVEVSEVPVQKIQDYGSSPAQQLGVGVLALWENGASI